MQSTNTPIFDCVVELSGDHNTFRVVWNPSDAAKKVLDGETIARDTVSEPRLQEEREAPIKLLLSWFHGRMGYIAYALGWSSLEMM